MNFDKMLLPELKTEAKARKVKGFSTMKKAELVTALKATEVKAEKPSYVEAIKAALRNEKDASKLKGSSAGREAKVTDKMSPGRKASAYMDSRNGNGTICNKLTPAQARRVRKTEKQFAGH